MPELHIDDAIDFIVRHLAGDPSSGVSIQSVQHYDIEIQHVAAAFWDRQGVPVLNRNRSENEPYLRPFLDAAWYLCRIGVLRPGENATGLGMRGPGWNGDGYSVTAHGRAWLQTARDRPPTDPTRFAEVMRPYGSHFGVGFLQRATEAARCYMTSNYFACCAMAGAAAESVLLAVAIKKVGDEQRF